MVGQHLPAALLAQVCGAPVSTGWLAGLPGEASAGLAPFLLPADGQLVAEGSPARRRNRVADIRRSLLVPRRRQWAADPALTATRYAGVETLGRHMAVLLPFFKGVLVTVEAVLVGGGCRALCAPPS